MIIAKILRLGAAGAVAACMANAASAADPSHPTVVELFQSQGCSSCPPANANLNAIASRPDVLALSFAVTYWDQLGWKDIFAHPTFTARQWEYSRAAARRNVSTPQIIVNGRGVLVGDSKAELGSFLKRFDRGTSGPRILVSASRIGVAAGTTGRPANVWLVRYDPRTHQVPIRAGENGGRTLPHKNIVRSLHLLGKWNGRTAIFARPALGDGSFFSAVLIQDGPGGAILAARRV